ncbi:MAG: peptidoglycan recognition protein family protein [Actinomycetia bacterium]|nr:peptidoglycan recognition protein family protein [Actinomycetes bacterium]
MRPATIVAHVGNVPGPPDGGGNSVSRRRLLAIAGGAGLASIVAGCSADLTANSTASPLPTRQPMATPAPTAMSSEVMLCRDAWGARPALPGGREHTIDRMTIHHSAVPLPDNRQIIARLQQHQRFHQDDKGWVDIAYHAAVDRDGNVFALRDTAIAGDTATDYDTTGHFLILCEGNFDDETITEAQLDGAALVCAWATREFGIGVDTLAGHRDVARATSCPGTGLEAHLTSGDLTQRISDLIDTGFDLQPLCGPPADARVAGIEAGR